MRDVDECRHTAGIRIKRLQPIVGREDRSPAEKDDIPVPAGVSDVTARVRVESLYAGRP